MAINLKDLEIFSDSLGNNFGGNAGSSGGGFNFLGGVIPNIANIANIVTQQQQGPVLGPDDFGSYTIPVSDPTYRSGFDYARSIAGGIPMSQVIAPGVSYSPEQPGGYTQEQLNIPKDVDIPPPPPAILPPTREPDDPRYFGTGIGGVTIPVDRKMPPLRDIFGGSPTEMPLPIPDYDPRNIDIDAIRQQIADSGIDFTNLFGLPKYETPDLSEFVRKEDIPSFIPDVPTGREFSIDREELMKDIRESIDLPKYEVPDLSGFARIEDIPTVPTFNEEALRKELMEDIRGSINIPQMPDLSGLARLEDIPTFDPDILKQDILMSIPQTQVPDVSKFVTQDDITKAIAGIDIPTFQQPDLSAYDTRIAELEQQLAGLKQPTGGSFSISQPRPMGLF